VNRRLDELLYRFPALTDCSQDIERAYEVLRACFAGGCKVLVCGNGGSAADAEHWAAELLKGFVSRRPLSPDARKALAPKLFRAPCRRFPSQASSRTEPRSPTMSTPTLSSRNWCGPLAGRAMCLRP
jgi:hypothetical protein